MRREPTEHWEQVQFVTLFRYKYRNVRIFHIPNGEFRGYRTGQRLKDEGVLPGVPDLFIPEWGLWIEMKRRHGGVLSAEQKDFLNYLSAVGYMVAVCRGCDEALAVADEVAGRIARRKGKENGANSSTST